MSGSWKQACLVELAPTSTWRRICDSTQSNKNTKELTFSASGILIKPATNGCLYVITHGSILISHFSHKKALAKLLKTNVFGKEAFVDLKVLVTLDQTDRLGSLKSGINNKLQKNNYRFNATSSNFGVDLEQCAGDIECVWKADGFAHAIQTFMPSSEGWSFFEEPEKNADVKSDEVSPRLVAALLPYFVLIRLEDRFKCDIPGYLSDKQLAIGDTVHMVGTPFASMSPSVFLNSVSQGVVCNVAGSRHQLIVTDARCIPGTEGGPLYSGDTKHSGGVVGVVASALCWKANEWIGLSLVCSMREVIKSLVNLADISLDPEAVYHQKHTPAVCESLPLCGDTPVVLVRCHGSWGSGLIMDKKLSLVITCGHVIKGQDIVRVKMDDGRWYSADVLHATPPNHVYDIGLLQVQKYTPSEIEPKSLRVASSVKQGDQCCVVGHAVFGQQHNLPPSVTSGVVSKVIGPPGAPIMLQSTCTVNAGASGGALIAADGSVLGIISCNAKDTVTGASYPNINLAVSVSTIWPALQNYIHTRDRSVLKALHINDKNVKDLWSMHDRERNFDALRSKL